MRKLSVFILFIALCLSPLFASADSIKWKNYSSGVFKSADNAHLPVMLFAMSDNCQWCHKMQATTFSDDTVIKLVNDNFYPVILRVNQNEAAAEKYKLQGVPTLIFFDQGGKIIDTLSGYRQPEEITRNLTNLVRQR
jgi:thioredoxin-related protein